jgi:hypothetical protein
MLYAPTRAALVVYQVAIIPANVIGVVAWPSSAVMTAVYTMSLATQGVVPLIVNGGTVTEPEVADSVYVCAATVDGTTVYVCIDYMHVATIVN